MSIFSVVNMKHFLYILHSLAIVGATRPAKFDVVLDFPTGSAVPVEIWQLMVPYVLTRSWMIMLGLEIGLGQKIV